MHCKMSEYDSDATYCSQVEHASDSNNQHHLQYLQNLQDLQNYKVDAGGPLPIQPTDTFICDPVPNTTIRMKRTRSSTASTVKKTFSNTNEYIKRSEHDKIINKIINARTQKTKKSTRNSNLKLNENLKISKDILAELKELKNIINKNYNVRACSGISKINSVLGEINKIHEYILQHKLYILNDIQKCIRKNSENNTVRDLLSDKGSVETRPGELYDITLAESLKPETAKINKVLESIDVQKIPSELNDKFIQNKQSISNVSNMSHTQGLELQANKNTFLKISHMPTQKDNESMLHSIFTSMGSITNNIEGKVQPKHCSSVSNIGSTNNEFWKDSVKIPDKWLTDFDNW